MAAAPFAFMAPPIVGGALLVGAAPHIHPGHGPIPIHPQPHTVNPVNPFNAFPHFMIPAMHHQQHQNNQNNNNTIPIQLQSTLPAPPPPPTLQSLYIDTSNNNNSGRPQSNSLPSVAIHRQHRFRNNNNTQERYIPFHAIMIL